jgi:uncharacterized integral membrane protein
MIAVPRTDGRRPSYSKSAKTSLYFSLVVDIIIVILSTIIIILSDEDVVMLSFLVSVFVVECVACVLTVIVMHGLTGAIYTGMSIIQ